MKYIFIIFVPKSWMLDKMWFTYFLVFSCLLLLFHLHMYYFIQLYIVTDSLSNIFFKISQPWNIIAP